MRTLFPEPGETIEGVGAALRAGSTSCAGVLEHAFHQIDLWDERVRAWVYVDRAGAMRQARSLDAELAEGRCRGPLHGIPFGVKDIFDVQGQPTAAGFAPWRDRVAEADGEVVARLRRAGAVILGKTVTTQFAWLDPPRTLNPWDLTRTPGGSSSGSAAAVATGMVLGALGSQTGGSITRPASFCGVCGFKPTKGHWSEAGVLPLSPRLDHPGPIARTVRDLALIVDAVSGNDGRPAVAPRSPERPPKLARPRGFFDRRADPEMLDAFEAAVRTLADAGAAVVDLDDAPFDFEGLLSAHRLILAYEAAKGHERRLAENGAAYAPHVRALVEEGRSLSPDGYRGACDRQDEDRAHGFPGFGVDAPALIVPATVGAAPDTSTTGNPSFNAPWSFLGWPLASFPVGRSPEGLPLAVQVVGAPGADREVLGVAAWCEDVIRRASRAGGTEP